TGRTDGFEPDPRRDEGGHAGLECADGVNVGGAGAVVDSVTLYDAGEFEALEARLWALDTPTADSENNRGCALARLGKKDKALAAFRRGLELPTDSDSRERIERNIERVEQAS
ncbi:MAG: tetratricopeptide repeat protein, partial [Actinomycetota bacterium]|nr:tetratricopeptide repeat protein [Actinomycetota bacterium]